VNISNSDSSPDEKGIVSAWVDPEFAREHGIDTPSDGWIKPPKVDSPRELPPGPRPVWGAWPTIGFSLLVVLAQFLVTFLVSTIFIAVEQNPSKDAESIAKSLTSNGLYVSLVVIVSAPICIALTAIFVKVRRGPSLREYLGLGPIPYMSILKWLGIVLLFIVATTILGALAHASDSDWTEDMYQSTSYLPLLWIAVVVAAPLFEEILFRGFLLTGLRSSILGPVGAVALTSVGWAMLHIQYNAFGIFVIFGFGLLLGIARLSSRSLYPPLVMHAFMNLLTMVLLQIYL
jgi:membrane protease YdiL (CAAX protease family)